MKITLLELTLLNFKGVRQQTIPFDDITNISGDNGTGKTTVFDAFLWLLFGKDSTDRKEFEIKTLDENNQPYHRLEHEVKAKFLIDGIETDIRRCYREKWQKKRGSADLDFTGHEQEFFWDDVPMQLKEYQQKISSLINEGVFKLITNTAYFNSMKWQDRRAVLMQLAGKVNQDDVLDAITTPDNQAQVSLLAAALNQRKTIAQYRSEINAKKKKIKDELDTLPDRIEEATRAIPEPVDYTEIENQIFTVENDIDGLDGLLQNSSAGKKSYQENINNALNQKAEHQRTLQQIESKLKTQVLLKSGDRKENITVKKAELRRKNDLLQNIRTDYTTAVARYNYFKNEHGFVTKEWEETNEKQLVFNDKEFCCPACKRAFEAADVDAKKEELTKNFNADKSKRLAELIAKGKELTTEMETFTTKINNLKADGEKTKLEVENLQANIIELEKEDARLSSSEIDELANLIAADKTYQDTKNLIDGLDEIINQPYAAEDNSALLQRKASLKTQLDELKRKLASKDLVKQQQDRVAELTEQESRQAQELANYEAIEFCIDQYVKTEMDIVSDRINGRFKLVTFKMFSDNLNGGTEECCETLINGVPYSDANTASKINAGLDIINTLSSHYDVYAPVFVDNAESVNTLVPVNSQLIRLVVSNDKKLKIEHSGTGQLKKAI